MTNEALFISSEIKELEVLLASVPAENLIERMSLETRLANAREALALLPAQVSQKARLTFRGRPVIGSHGIAADFGAKATGAFSDAFAAIAAALSDGLQDMGPIPDRNKNQLLITGTAIGSSGSSSSCLRHNRRFSQKQRKHKRRWRRSNHYSG